MTAVPRGLRSGGRALWRAIADAHDLDPAQAVQLTEACRAKDRLDQLDLVLRGEVETWAEVVTDDQHVRCRLQIAPALARANETANLMKQLLAALRLPDAQTGKRPQYRGARGAQAPSVPGGKVSSIERARQRAGKGA
jgi:hypothetical protein